MAKSSMDQFVEGLENVKLLDVIRKDPKTWRPLFVYPNAPISADDIKQLFIVLYTEDGSNLKRKQEDAYVHFCDFLDECSEGDISKCSPEDVLVFFSGSSYVPPLGFDLSPSLSFIDNGVLATASTCDIQLRIPIVHESYEQFRDAMVLSVNGHDGFGTS